MIHYDVVYPNIVASKARGDPLDGMLATSSTYCDALENQGGADGQIRAVGATSIASVAERLLITS